MFAWFAYNSADPSLAVQQTLDLMVQRAYWVMTNDVLISVPLFVFMGYLVERANLIQALFKGLHLATSRIPGSLAVATIITCAIFATASGIIGAVVTLMGLLAFPAMLKAGYNVRVAAGSVTAGGTLGILIPPSVNMIVYGSLTNNSIGKLFIAGIIPGLLVVCLYIGYILWVAKTQPHRVGEGVAPSTSVEAAAKAGTMSHQAAAAIDEPDLRTILWSTAGIIVLVLLVLGGIWFGFFTPTEGAGVGATLALLLAIARGMKPREMVQAVISVGRTSAPLLILLVTAQLYSRVLSMTGITGMAKDFFLQSGLSPYAILALMILVWFILGNSVNLLLYLSFKKSCHINGLILCPLLF
jgi:tripartite ATP-independent transporter DctM subunit